MSDGFYSKRSVWGVQYALIMLMVVFFFVPFAGRGARMALQKTENNVKDWLPNDFRETEELAWFAKRFVSEQFIVATWDGCNEESQRLKMFVSKLRSEQEPTPTELEQSAELVRARQLGTEYALFLSDDDYRDWGGLDEKWLIDEHGRNYYVTPNGKLWRWDGNPNVVGMLWRTLSRAVGSFKLDGQFIAAFGSYGTDETPNQFWAEPRLLTAPLFKSIDTGPDVVAQLAGEGGSLYTSSEPAAGQRQATARLTGTLFGPPVPVGFSWTSEQLRELLSPELLAKFPEGWEGSWNSIVERAVDASYGGDLDRLRTADPVDQAAVWYDFFDAIAVTEPARQTCVMMTLSAPARRNLAKVIGRGMLGQPRGRLFDIAEECGISAPPVPSMAPPPFSWLAVAEQPSEPLLHIGGPPVDNVAIDEEGTITLVRLIGYSLALGLGLSLFCLQSVRLMLMVFFVGGVSAMASLSLVWWCGASVDAILLTMPSLVYVLGISGAIHIVNYYRDAIAEGGSEGAPERAIAHAVVPCTLAALTTAIGLLSLCSSNILPIRKFGIFSAMGVMTTLVLLYIYLPSALTIFPPRRKVETRTDHAPSGGLILTVWEAIGRFILRHHWWVNGCCFALLIGLGIGLTKIETSVQLLKLFDSNSQIIQDYAWLEEHFGRLVPMELVVRFPESLQRPSEFADTPSYDEIRQSRLQLSLLERADAVARIQKVLQKEFGYAGSNEVGRGMSAITFLKDMPEPWRGFNPQRAAANRLLEQSRDQLLASDYLALESSPVARNTELWRISLRLGALNNVDYGQFVSSLRSAVEPVVAGYRCRQEILKTILAKHPQEVEGVYGDVLFLGHGSPVLASGADQAAGEPEGQANGIVNDTRVLAETLSACLINETVRQMDWHDPVKFPLTEGKATSEKWAKYLQQYACVVLLSPHPDYDIEFIKASTPNLIDASSMLAEIRATVRAPRVATGEPVELSARPGEIDVVYTGIVPVVYKAQRTLLESLIQSVAWAFALIAIVMACLLSHGTSILDGLRPMNLLQAISCGALSMIPNVFPVVIIFGIMGHSGLLIDIGSMMTASVAMGVAVDDTIHFLTWFRDGLRKGLDRRDAIFRAYRHVAPAMTQTTIIGGLGLSVFALSTFTPTQRFGTLMLALLVAALLGDLIFLPSLLASPLGKIFTKRKSGRRPQDSHSQVGEELSPPTSLPSIPTPGVAPSRSHGDSGLDQQLGESTAAIPPPQMVRRDRSHVRKR